ANWTLAALVCVVIYLMGEGVLAINQWERSHRSLTYQAVQVIDGMSGQTKPRFFRPLLSDPREIEVLLEDMRSAGVGLGNSPYEQLRTKTASIARQADDCPQNRPNISKTLTYLRSPLFEMFNPVVMFYDNDRELSDRLQRFVERYGVRLTTFTSDEFGQRKTIPVVDRQEIVFIAGDSVAAGAMINDDETLASVLQRRDPNRRYINLGRGGAEAAEIRCNVELAAERYPNRVQELIYVYCENDFDDDESMGTPEAVMTWLRQFVREQAIDRTTIVYAPYIFNVVPELTRVPGERGERFEDHADNKARLVALVQDAGFTWVDFGELALAEADARGTPFAALGLYIDVVHHSPLGVDRLADALAAGNGPKIVER
ncbi:MAG: SGNH/GDSL hydrolase family protein, partial [Geminicoccaceae bacterium]